MNYRERILAAVKRKATDRIPWAPRMDLWYIANKAKGTLPKGFENLNTVGIANKLGCACYAVRADYTLPKPMEELILRGFGIDNHPDYPYRIELNSYPVNFSMNTECMETIIRAPAGELVSRIRQDQDMVKDGVSVPFVESYPIHSPKDIPAVAQIFNELEVIPLPEKYTKFKERIGDSGLAVAHGMHTASPMHLILHDLMPIDQFFYLYMDDRKLLDRLCESIAGFCEKILNAVLLCDSEVFFWGGNYDQNTTYPDFYSREIAPWLRKVGKKAEAVGKFVLTHTDGENRDLLPLYRESGFHVAESVCSIPMTSTSLKEFREGVGKGISVWGGIPAVALLEDSMSGREFHTYLDTLFSELGTGEGLILGVSDNVPPAASFVRMEEIARRIEEFGSVSPES
ncbi:MAG TPA: uroporphyrinogen decarboxylase family protein [Spirochaetales bacterium]|nr:hypothetical protein [Spirochaetales bacterium]HOV38741.1 uroporphyrinogen decarboxylase family protein [Spirochaetales bacterium]